ncbi:hypothetical protein J6590_106569 [Homalodisca vitripennis]|nr:hypothetical protein J6590_106569 [Homalodisca vitripennis]
MYSENDTSYHRRARWRDSRREKVTIAGPDGVTRGGRRVSTLITLHLSPNQNITVKHTNNLAAFRIFPMVCWPPRTRHQLPSLDQMA